jgi:protein-tyrosine-phosphatase
MNEALGPIEVGRLPASGEVHPLALELLSHHGFSFEKFRSKSWIEFTGPATPHFDFVISVCERPAEDVWNAWPQDTVKAHWRITDPASAEGSPVERMNAFRRAFRELENRIKLFTMLRHRVGEEPSRAA